MLADIETVEKTKAVLDKSVLFYGGGIKDAETAERFVMPMSSLSEMPYMKILIRRLKRWRL